MSTATRWYTTREAVKAAVGIAGASLDALIDSYIEAASQKVESEIRRRFIPETAIKYFPWPAPEQGRTVIFLDRLDLLAVTALLADAQGASPITIDAADFFLEPVNDGPPYSRIEIDTGSDAAFETSESPQRSVSIAGRWGYSETTKTAGALAAEIASTTATTCTATDASLIGVGDTLLIESEALFVSGRALADTTADLGGNLTAAESNTTVPVDDGTLVKQGEVITIDSERMLVESIAGNNLTVQRAYDGSTLAAHTSGADVYAPRLLTVVRGVNGTTAATHAVAKAIAKYAPPADITDLCRAEAIARHEQGRSGWTGQIGGSEGSVETRMFNLHQMWRNAHAKYRRRGVA